MKLFRITRRRLLAGGAAVSLGAALSGYRSLLAGPPRKPLYVDGLSFLPDDPRDIAASGLDAFILDASVAVPITDSAGRARFVRTFENSRDGLEAAVRQIDDIPHAYVATRGSEIGRRRGTGVFLQFQSCRPIEDKLERIAYFYRRGLRVLQITHHNNNAFGGGALEADPIGLTPLGIAGVAEMNRLGIVVDISHASEATALDVCRHSMSPVVLSHGACRALLNNPRCASDAVIRAVADSGGVMGVFMYSFWLTDAPAPTIGHYLAHIRHIIKVGGLDSVGIANDFQVDGLQVLKDVDNDNALGAVNFHDWWRAQREQGVPGYSGLPQHVVIPELNDVKRMYTIHRALERTGFSADAIDKIMGGNWIRVLRTVLG